MIIDRHEDEKQGNSSQIQNHELIKKFFTTLDSISDFVVITNMNLEIEFVNSALLKRVGLSKEELLGKSGNLFISPLNEIDKSRFIENILNNGSWKGDLILKSKTGEEFWTSVEATLLTENGINIGITTISRDITERKLAEAKLKESEEKYQILVNNLKEIIFQTDAEGIWTFLNPAWEEITGFSVDESLGELFLNYVHPDDRQRNQEKFLPLINREKDYCRHVIRYLTKDGGYKWIEVFARLTLDKNNNIIGTTGTLSDITDRINAEEELIKSKTQLKAILDNIPLLAWLKNDSLRYIAVNEPYANSLGLSSNELLGKTDLEIFPKDSAIQSIEDDLEVIKQGLQKFNEFPIIEGKKTRWIESFKTPIFNEDSEVIGITSVERDITERKEAENEIKNAKEAADRANRAKSDFLANMSHEIRTPMNAILGFTELLKNQITNQKQRDYLNGITISGNNLLNLINDILDLSKIEAGKTELHFETVNYHQMLNEIKQIFSIKILEKDLEFIMDISPQIPKHLILDEMKVRQILLNLIGNAIKFTHEGSVTLRSYTQANEEKEGAVDLYIEVIDTGIGIPKEEQNAVFEAFRQQEGQSTRKYGGTGLGLTISKKLVEIMHGEISLASESGKGSIFRLRIPDIKPAHESETTHQKEDYKENRIICGNKKILIVDDNEYNNIVIKGFFEGHEVTLLEADNGKTAVELAESEQPDLIMMDIQMPVMNGFEATEIIKSLPGTKSTPIIALSASVIFEENSKQKKMFDGYLRKPVLKSTLIRELIKYLPFKEGEKKDIQIESNEQLKSLFSEKDLINLNLSDNIKGEIKNTFYNRWKELHDGMFIDDILEFADDFKKFGIECKIHEIVMYASALYEASDSFEIDKIGKLLKIFPKFQEE